MENSTDSNEREFVSPKELAARLGISAVTVYRLIKSGRLDAAILDIGSHATRIDLHRAIRALRKKANDEG